MASPLVERRHEMDRLFDSFMRDPFGSLLQKLGGGERAWLPTIDVAQDVQEVTVRAELPGVDPEDLEITVSGNRLTLSGEKKERVEKRDKDSYQSESRLGAFRRSIELPNGVDPEKVSAEHANGVVTTRLEKSKPEMAKRIPIKPSRSACCGRLNCRRQWPGVRGL